MLSTILDFATTSWSTVIEFFDHNWIAAAILLLTGSLLCGAIAAFPASGADVAKFCTLVFLTGGALYILGAIITFRFILSMLIGEGGVDIPAVCGAIGVTSLVCFVALGASNMLTAAPAQQ